MITLHRLNDKPFVLNAELIRTVEENPDTIITLVSGDHMVVRESMREVVERSIEYGRHLRRLLAPS
ncbi:MAG: flagellar FlbD family protein [Planctomycetota bacterium]|nr:MAG: flagellar FlbD family protein [Planctomycetota bacterium]